MFASVGNKHFDKLVLFFGLTFRFYMGGCSHLCVAIQFTHFRPWLLAWSQLSELHQNPVPTVGVSVIYIQRYSLLSQMTGRKVGEKINPNEPVILTFRTLRQVDCCRYRAT